MDEEQLSPIGFDIIFPSMIQVAAEMDIDLHLTQTDINAVLRRKDIEIKRYIVIQNDIVKNIVLILTHVEKSHKLNEVSKRREIRWFVLLFVMSYEANVSVFYNRSIQSLPWRAFLF